MHLHCHLWQCMIDVGPVYSFWCFSFERYNGLLEGMQKTWCAPEVQLFHKISNFQSIMYMDVPLDTSIVVSEMFQQLRSSKLTQAQDVTDLVALNNGKMHFLLSIFSLCS